MFKRMLLAVLVLLLVTSCADQTQLLPFLKEIASDITFNGKTFYIMSDISPSDSVHETFLSYGATTQNYDAAMKRFADVEKQFDCILEFTTPIGSRDMLTAATAGTKIDLVIHPIYYGGFGDIMQGIYTPISEIPAIDYMNSEKWGSPNMLEIFCYQNDIYGVIPALWPISNIMSSDFLLVINEEMAAKNSITDPRDLFEQGLWTHENFYETVTLFYNDEDPNRIIYGYAGSERHFLDMALKSFNVDFLGEGLSNGYKRPEFIEALDWAKQLLIGEYSEMARFNGMDCIDYWVDERTGIATVHMNYLASMSGRDSSSAIINSDKEYGIVPFPSLDGKTIHAQYERVINAIMFPSWEITNEDMGIIANAIFEPFEGLDTIEKQIEDLNTNLFFDERDSQLIFDMMTQAKYLYHDEGINDFHTSLVGSMKTKSSAQIQQENVSVLDSIIKKYIIPARTSMEYIFGSEE